MSIFLENSVYLVYLISLLMRHVPRRKKWHAKHCSIFRNTMIHTSGCSSFCGNVLPEMALFVFPPLGCGPFNGIFNNQTLGSRSVLEVSTLIAMMVSALIVWGIVSLGKVIFVPSL